MTDIHSPLLPPMVDPKLGTDDLTKHYQLYCYVLAAMIAKHGHLDESADMIKQALNDADYFYAQWKAHLDI